MIRRKIRVHRTIDGWMANPEEASRTSFRVNTAC